MGPRSFDRGNLGRLSSITGDTDASMGPRSFDRGNSICGQNADSNQICFNGAAVF